MTGRKSSPHSHGKQAASPTCLACPFYILDPVKYKSCGGKRLRHPSDLRVHFYRSHARPPFCSACKLTFKGKDANLNRNRHIAERQCRRTLKPNPPGLTEDQFIIISKKREIAPFQDLNLQARQWYSMWQVCCPGYPFPPPESISRPGFGPQEELSRAVDAAPKNFFPAPHQNQVHDLQYVCQFQCHVTEFEPHLEFPQPQKKPFLPQATWFDSMPVYGSQPNFQQQQQQQQQQQPLAPEVTTFGHGQATQTQDSKHNYCAPTHRSSSFIDQQDGPRLQSNATNEIMADCDIYWLNLDEFGASDLLPHWPGHGHGFPNGQNDC